MSKKWGYICVLCPNMLTDVVTLQAMAGSTALPQTAGNNSPTCLRVGPGTQRQIMFAEMEAFKTVESF